MRVVLWASLVGTIGISGPALAAPTWTTCSNTDPTVVEVPNGASVTAVHVNRYTGNVPRIKLQYNHGNGWLYEQLDWREIPDKLDADIPFDMTKFGSTGAKYLVRAEAQWSDEGTWNGFPPNKISKECTAN